MKIANRILILFLIVSLELSEQVSDCETVDLRSSFGPVNDQQDIGWCYAYTAADLVNFHFASTLQGKKISPFHIALLSNANDGNNFRSQGGSTKMAIDLALAPKVQNSSIFNKGICFQETDRKIINENVKISIHAFYKQLDELFKLYQQAKTKHDQSSKEAFMITYEELKKQNSPIVSIDQKKLFDLFDYANIRDLGVRFLDLFCSEKERFVAPQGSYAISLYMGGVKTVIPKYGPSIQTQINDPAILIKEMKDLLDNKKIPLGIGFYYRFLKVNNPSPGGEMHAAVVVGKEKLNNSCHFIIRNSWGDCPDPKGKDKYSSNITKCEKGYLWVKESILSKHLDSMEYIK